MGTGDGAVLWWTRCETDDVDDSGFTGSDGVDVGVDSTLRGVGGDDGCREPEVTFCRGGVGNGGCLEVSFSAVRAVCSTTAEAPGIVAVDGLIPVAVPVNRVTSLSESRLSFRRLESRNNCNY